MEIIWQWGRFRASHIRSPIGLRTPLRITCQFRNCDARLATRVLHHSVSGVWLVSGTTNAPIKNGMEIPIENVLCTATIAITAVLDGASADAAPVSTAVAISSRVVDVLGPDDLPGYVVDNDWSFEPHDLWFHPVVSHDTLAPLACIHRFPRRPESSIHMPRMRR
jgi:hypothetical protein